MSEGIEPNAADILSSKLGVNSAVGSHLALRFLVTGLLVRLHEKGMLTDAELDVIFDVATAAALDIFSDELSPNAAEYAYEIRAAAEKTLASMRSEIQST